MKLSKIIAGALILGSSVVWADGFSPFKKDTGGPQESNALPSDPLTKVVAIYDPALPGVAQFRLLLTNHNSDTGAYAGYKLECDDNALMNAMYIGLGFEIDLGTGLEWKSLYDPEVLASNYNDRLTLSCRASETQQLFIVDYPEDLPEDEVLETGFKYFIFEKDYSFGNNLHMVGCQGLMTAMGFDIDSATVLTYDVAQGFLVNVGDENDIHCTNGDRVGYCGEYPHADTWEESIENGTQTFSCDSGVALKNGLPDCNEGFELEGEICVQPVEPPANCDEHEHGTIWSQAIDNGTQTYQCNDGVTTIVGAPRCNSDSTEQDNQCYKKCGNRTHNSQWNESINNGNQEMVCNNGVTVPGVITCNDNSKKIDNVCYQECGVQDGASREHGDIWDHPVGGGNQEMTCNDGSVISGDIRCSTGFTQVANICYQDCGAQDGASRKHGDTWDRSVLGGVQAMSCSNGVVSEGQISCSTGYTKYINQCYKDCGTQNGAYRKHGAQWPATISNGTQFMSCADGSVTAGQISCASNATNINGSCLLKCGNYNHGQQWSVKISHGSQIYQCDNGAGKKIGGPNCDSNYTASGSVCVYVPQGCENNSQAHGSTWTVVRSDTSGGPWCEYPQYRHSYQCDDGDSNWLGKEKISNGMPDCSGQSCC